MPPAGGANPLNRSLVRRDRLAVLRWPVLWLAAAGLLAALLPVVPRPPVSGDGDGAGEPTETALREGNRLARDGDLEGALAAYDAGWRSAGGGDAVAAVLAYNRGTAAHRLGRLPEALLWYRRAERLRPEDAWTTDNLAHARGQLAAGEDPPPPPRRPALRPLPFAVAGLLLAWLALALAAARSWLAAKRLAPRLARGAWGAAAALALAAWGAAAAVGAWGPRPAVLLAGCGHLPAGSEVAARPASGGAWRVTGGAAGGGETTDGSRRAVCPAESIGVVAAP